MIHEIGIVCMLMLMSPSFLSLLSVFSPVYKIMREARQKNCCFFCVSCPDGGGRVGFFDSSATATTTISTTTATDDHDYDGASGEKSKCKAH